MGVLWNTAKRGGLLLLTVVAVCVMLLVPVQAQKDRMTITIRENIVVGEGGQAKLDETWTFSPPQTYDRIKKAYPNLYILFRDFGSDRSSMEIERNSMQIATDDQKRSINFKATILGYAVCKRNRWEIALGPDEEVVDQDANKVFTTTSSNPQYGMFITTTFSYFLPAKAQSVTVDKSRHLLTYAVPHQKVTAGQASVEVDLRCKEQLMSALYKIYADPEVGGGAYWVAKAVIKNKGNVPLYDLKVWYKLGDYTEMRVPETFSVVMPGGSVVDLYYPFIAARVTDLKTRTPVNLYVKYQYTNPDGKVETEEMSERLDILGVNQFVWTNLNKDELTDSWFDYFNNSSLLAAFVTRMDDAVKQFAGYVSEAAGGAAASAKDEDAIKWLRAAYNLELANNIVYQTPSSFMTVGQGLVQEIKFPRDVFRDKAGTCVDLAITYAAIAEATGLKANLLLIPGHCFAVIELPSGDLLPVENTGLGGGSNRLSFDDAVKIGTKEFNDAVQKGVFYFVDVRQEQTDGRIPNPELPAVPADFLKSVGITRAGGGTSTTGSTGTSGTGTGAGSEPQTIFFDNFNNVSGGWPTDRGDGQVTSYVSGEYEIKLTKKTIYSYAAPIDGKLPADYIVQADARVQSGAKGYYGLVFNLQDWDLLYYLFAVDPGYRSFCLWKVRGGQIQTVVEWTSSNYINTSSNQLAVGQMGNQAVLFINGQRLTNSISLESVGKDVRVGVMGGNFGILSTTIRFDNFLVTDVPQ